MKVSSIEIAFRRDRIIQNKLYFDLRFGLGSDFPTGEEVIFLSDALKMNLKIKYIPKVIVIHPAQSSGGAYTNNPKLIQAKGAMFYRIFGFWGYFISILFAVKKFNSSNYSLLNFFMLMIKGIRSFKNET